MIRVKKHSRPSILAVTFSLISIPLASCSFVERNTIGLFSSSGDSKEASITEESNHTSSTPKEIAPDQSVKDIGTSSAQPAPVQQSGIEVVWKIPDEPTEGFIVFYGSEKDKLEHQVKLESVKLERIEDAQNGFVYRYLLKEASEKKPTYIAIAAFNGQHVSPMGEVFSVSAGE